MQECVDLMMLLERMSERMPAIDVIEVATAASLTGDVTVLLQVDDDLHRGALGDADELRKITDAHVGCLGDREQDVRVVGEEGPGSPTWILRHAHSLATRLKMVVRIT